MQINPEAERFGEIVEAETTEQQEAFAKMVEEGHVVALGPEEQLQKLQDDLRKRGYRKMNFGPLKP